MLPERDPCSPVWLWPVGFWRGPVPRAVRPLVRTSLRPPGAICGFWLWLRPIRRRRGVGRWRAVRPTGHAAPTSSLAIDFHREEEDNAIETRVAIEMETIQLPTEIPLFVPKRAFWFAVMYTSASAILAAVSYFFPWLSNRHYCLLFCLFDKNIRRYRLQPALNSSIFKLFAIYFC